MGRGIAGMAGAMLAYKHVNGPARTVRIAIMMIGTAVACFFAGALYSSLSFGEEGPELNMYLPSAPDGMPFFMRDSLTAVRCVGGLICHSACAELDHAAPRLRSAWRCRQCTSTGGARP